MSIRVTVEMICVGLLALFAAFAFASFDATSLAYALTMPSELVTFFAIPLAWTYFSNRIRKRFLFTVGIVSVLILVLRYVPLSTDSILDLSRKAVLVMGIVGLCCALIVITVSTLWQRGTTPKSGALV